MKKYASSPYVLGSRASSHVSFPELLPLFRAEMLTQARLNTCETVLTCYTLNSHDVNVGDTEDNRRVQTQRSFAASTGSGADVEAWIFQPEWGVSQQSPRSLTGEIHCIGKKRNGCFHTLNDNHQKWP